MWVIESSAGWIRWCMERDPAFGIWTERAIAWEAASTGLQSRMQARRRTCRQDGTHCLGGFKQAGSTLTNAEILLSPDAYGSIARLGNRDDETVDQHAVTPVQKSGLRARTIYWERRARISSWLGCNSSPLARGRIHLCN